MSTGVSYILCQFAHEVNESTNICKLYVAFDWREILREQGNSNRFQYSLLMIPWLGGAWQAIVLWSLKRVGGKLSDSTITISGKLVLNVLILNYARPLDMYTLYMVMCPLCPYGL